MHIVCLEVCSSRRHPQFTANPLQVSLIQAWHYYTHQNDRWPLKTLVSSHSYLLPAQRNVSLIFQVSAVIICDVVHQALITHSSPLSFSLLAFRLTRVVY